jgi:aspartyl-tRNA synthetase
MDIQRCGFRLYGVKLRRTHKCSELSALQGWVHRHRDHGGLIFVDLRDRDGWTQVVFNPELAPEAHAVASDVRSEFVLEVEGTVARRPEGTENTAIPTGEIELVAERVAILNPSLPLPFSIADDGVVDESVRLKYRYLDLRRPRMARNLVMRHQVNKFIRDYLDREGFLEVETPIMTKSTPEGARDYLVPSRVHPGSFYALPQSPQQYKQLLMVGGVDRYFQIARCFRDEDLRADRTNEFTQLDLEMSFVEEDDVLDLMESLFTEMSESLTSKQVVKPFPRLTYQDAMARYGSDKPDLRYGMASVDLSSIFAETEFAVFRDAIAGGGQVRGMCVAGGASYSRRVIDELTEVAKKGGARGLAWAALDPGEIRSSFARFLSEGERAAMVERLGAREGDLVVAVADKMPTPSVALGAVRTDVARRDNLADPNVLAFARVTEFPLLEWDAAGNRWDAVHHPFTSPMEGDLSALEERPGEARARAYDIVCNGWELGGGSIRIHRRDVQERIFALLGYSAAEADERFGHLLHAFQYGAPPHGGVAFGLDRVAAIFADEASIRDVIAFPKNQSAADLLMGAPSAVTDDQLAELHIMLRPDVEP